jgi:hypothetical protein
MALNTRISCAVNTSLPKKLPNSYALINERDEQTEPVIFSCPIYFLLAEMDSSELGGAISPIWLYSFKNLLPFSVVLNICSEEL